MGRFRQYIQLASGLVFLKPANTGSENRKSQCREPGSEKPWLQLSMRPRIVMRHGFGPAFSQCFYFCPNHFCLEGGKGAEVSNLAPFLATQGHSQPVAPGQSRTCPAKTRLNVPRTCVRSSGQRNTTHCQRASRDGSFGSRVRCHS